MNNFKYISNLITDNQRNSTILYNIFHVALANWIEGIIIYVLPDDAYWIWIFHPLRQSLNT